MEDLSKLAKHSIGVNTGSMAATNTVSVVPAFGAPGGPSEGTASVSPADPAVDIDPVGSVNTDPKSGTDGKPQASSPSHYWNPGPPAWKTTA